MSDIKLFNMKTNEIIDRQKIDKIKFKSIIETNSDNLLGVTVIQSEAKIFDSQDIIETLGYDENHQLVVIEYRKGKFTSTINRGLVHLDLISNNQSRVKTYLNEKLGYELSKEIKTIPRLISIGDDYNLYDDHAIKQMQFIIDLIKYSIYEKNLLVLEKNYQSMKICNLGNPQFASKDIYNLYKAISDFVLSLGDEVVETRFDAFFSFRKIKNFIYLIFGESIEMKIRINNNFKTVKIKNYRDFEKQQVLIEQSYDEN